MYTDSFDAITNTASCWINFELTALSIYGLNSKRPLFTNPLNCYGFAKQKKLDEKEFN